MAILLRTIMQSQFCEALILRHNFVTQLFITRLLCIAVFCENFFQAFSFPFIVPLCKFLPRRNIGS
ncbi:hypothetical protein CPB84DRAFT_1789887 [Gymnopilus junonius]|uniref:Uncharacterized protein n=1 Tax=Gymnopilus junonius TaxID=109634 RepID=A0A9P5TJG4_GYMJU|nr:hypothetical protein CPB84DRAFT_1789887 [Gymnopilus junonius]